MSGKRFFRRGRLRHRCRRFHRGLRHEWPRFQRRRCRRRPLLGLRIPRRQSQCWPAPDVLSHRPLREQRPAGSLKSRLQHPLPAVRSANLTVLYSLSRFLSRGRDVEGNTFARDFRNPGSVTGPFGLDRTHKLSVGGVFQLPWWAQVSFITHYYTALPVFLRVAGSPFGGNLAGIFTSDLNGDGSYAGSTVGGGDFLPGSKLGALNRSV